MRTVFSVQRYIPQLSTTTACVIVSVAILCVSVAVAYGQYDDSYDGDPINYDDPSYNADAWGTSFSNEDQWSDTSFSNQDMWDSSFANTDTWGQDVTASDYWNESSFNNQDGWGTSFSGSDPWGDSFYNADAWGTSFQNGLFTQSSQYTPTYNTDESQLVWFSSDGARQSQNSMQPRPSEDLVWLSPAVNQTQPMVGMDTEQLAYYRNLALQAHAETHPSMRLGDESGMGAVNVHEIGAHTPSVYANESGFQNIHTQSHGEMVGLSDGFVEHMSEHGDGNMFGHGGALSGSEMSHHEMGASNTAGMVHGSADSHLFHPSDGLPGMIGMDHAGHAYFNNAGGHNGSHATHNLLALSHGGNHFDGNMGHTMFGINHSEHAHMNGDSQHAGHGTSSADHAGHNMGGGDHSGHNMSGSGEHGGHTMSTADHSGHSVGNVDHSAHNADHGGHTTANHAGHSPTDGSHTNHTPMQDHSGHVTSNVDHASHGAGVQHQQTHAQAAQHEGHSSAGMQMSGNGGGHAMHERSVQQTLEHGGGVHGNMLAQNHTQHAAALGALDVHDHQVAQHAMKSGNSAQHQHVEIPGVGSYSVLVHKHSGEAAGGKSTPEAQEHIHTLNVKNSFNQQKNLMYILFLLGGVGSMFILVGRMLFPRRRIFMQHSHHSR